MRQPTFDRRRRTRQQRLLRTAIGVVLLVAVAGLVANLVGGKEDGATPRAGESPSTPKVRFVGRFTGETEAERRPARAEVRKQGREIVDVLNDWYQRAFVDPKLFGNGTFPKVAARFDAGIRDEFTKDIELFTIGEARTEVARVEPRAATADIVIYFERARVPRFATADVAFRARGILKDASAIPLTIRQTMTLTLKRTRGGWFVVAYRGASSQKQPKPTPSPSPSPSP